MRPKGSRRALPRLGRADRDLSRGFDPCGPRHGVDRPVIERHPPVRRRTSSSGRGRDPRHQLVDADLVRLVSSTPAAEHLDMLATETVTRLHTSCEEQARKRPPPDQDRRLSDRHQPRIPQRLRRQRLRRVRQPPTRAHSFRQDRGLNAAGACAIPRGAAAYWRAGAQAICSTDEWVISALELLGICVVRHLAVMISRMWTFGSCKLAADQCVRNNGGGRYAVASRPRAPNRVAPTRGWDGLR